LLKDRISPCGRNDRRMEDAIVICKSRRSIFYILAVSLLLGCHSGSHDRVRPPASSVFSGIPIDRVITLPCIEGRV